MIVNRRVYAIKRGCMDKAIAWFKGLKVDTPIRMQRSLSGTTSTLAVELECESMAAYEKFEAEYMARPDIAKLEDKFWELVDWPPKSEFWRKVE